MTMSEQTTPTHEDLEHAFHAPQKVLARLPDSIEARESRRLIDVAEKLAHQARERVRPEDPD